MSETELTNEQLAQMAKEGDGAAMEELCTRNRGFAYMCVKRFLLAATRNNATDSDDLMQCAYMGIMRTVDAFDEERGSFLSVAKYYIADECRRLLGLRGRKREEHYSCLSAEAPMGEDGDLRLMDTFTDDDAIDPEGSCLARSVTWDIQRALDELPAIQGECISMHFFENMTDAEIGKIKGKSRSTCNVYIHAGIKKLRRSPYLAIYEDDYAYRHKTLAGFKYTHTSIVEDIVLRRWPSGNKEQGGISG